MLGIGGGEEKGDDEGIEDARGAHERLADKDGEIEEGSGNGGWEGGQRGGARHWHQLGGRVSPGPASTSDVLHDDFDNKLWFHVQMQSDEKVARQLCRCRC